MTTTEKQCHILAIMDHLKSMDTENTFAVITGRPVPNRKDDFDRVAKELDDLAVIPEDPR